MRLGTTLSVAIWAGVLALVAWFLYVVQEGRREEQRLRAAIARLSAEQRVARILVHRIAPDPESGEEITDFDWVETLPDGSETPPRAIRVRGDQVRFEALQIVFEGELIRDGDPLKGKSLHLFRRAYGQHQAPVDGVRLDVPEAAEEGTPEARPSVPAYFRGPDGEASALEQRLWGEFWDLARDQERSRSEGIRSAQGISVFKPLVEGKEYRLTLTATGQMILDGPLEPQRRVAGPH